MADSLPTKEGQNKIIGNLNLTNVFMSIITLAIGAAFAWVSKVGDKSTETQLHLQSLEDKMIKLEAKGDGQIKGVRADIEDIRSDISKIETDAEKTHDDLKMRTTKVEDWQKFYEMIHPFGKR